MLTDIPELILASTSPRRSELMTEAGYCFRLLVAPVEEWHDEAVPLQELTRSNAALKARAVADQVPEAIVIGADTLVCVDGRALGKPASLAEATAMLLRLSGRAHEVGTAVCLVHAGSRRSVSFEVVTKVMFKKVTPAEIAAYFLLVNPLDKAGGYAAQEHGEMIIDHFEGSLSNVVGLPMERLKLELEMFRRTLDALSVV